MKTLFNPSLLCKLLINILTRSAESGGQARLQTRHERKTIFSDVLLRGVRREREEKN